VVNEYKLQRTVRSLDGANIYAAAGAQYHGDRTCNGYYGKAADN